MRAAHCHCVWTLACAFAANTIAQTPNPPKRRTLVERATQATVTILTLTPTGDTIGQGSGFLLRANGVVVTSWHVMSGASRAVVIVSNNERYDRVGFLDGDSIADVVLLKIPAVGLPSLATRTDTPPVGSRAIVIGSPYGLAKTVTEGIVSATRLVEGRELIQVSAAVNPGSSGGPVLDSAGRVFGIVASKVRGGEQLNFAVPVRYALGLYKESAPERSLSARFGSETTQPQRSLAGTPRPTRRLVWAALPRHRRSS